MRAKDNMRSGGEVLVDQLVVHGVSTRAYNHPYESRPGIPPVNAVEKDVAGVYYARITYRDNVPTAWQF